MDTGTLLAVALIALVALATLLVARRPRRSRRPGGLQMLGAVLLGVGEPLDPPVKHAVEAKSEKPKGSPETGEPPL